MTIEDTANLLDLVRQRRPLVHNITNYVAMDITANVLLALGASPAMVHAEEEVEEFTGIASSLVVNLGTLSPAWFNSMKLAARVANARDIPWVLDPVAAGATRYRTESANDLLRSRPSVIRGNASEIMALAGVAHVRPQGVDASDEASEAVEAARELSRTSGSVVAVTGPTDCVTDGDQTLAIECGHPLLANVTGTGCSATAVIGAFLTVTGSAFDATAAGLAVFGAAGGLAGQHTKAPGSFRVSLIDALALLDTVAIAEQVRFRAL